MGTRFTSLRGVAAGALLLGAAAFALPAAHAQEDERFFAHIYAASCSDLSSGSLLDEIGELERSDDTTDDWRFLGSSTERPDPLFLEDEDMGDLDLEEITGAPHAIVVHEDEETSSAVLVCGDIQGEVGPDGGFVISLEQVDESGVEGRAWVGYEQNDDDDDDDEDLDLIVGIFTAGAVPPLATPDASPAATPGS